MEPRATSLMQVVERQCRRWELLREERRKSPEPVHWPVITIEREFGARGEALGRALAGDIGFSFWDQELVHALAEQSGADVVILKTLDEHRRTSIADSIEGLLLGGKYMNSEYLRRLVKLVRTIATHGSSIVVGRGAHYVVSPAEALRVRVVCPLEERVRSYGARNDLKPDAARKIVEREDEGRSSFLRQNFGKNGSDPSDYDVVVNTGGLPFERAGEPILAAYQAKFDSRPRAATEGSTSKRATPDERRSRPAPL